MQQDGCGRKTTKCHTLSDNMTSALAILLHNATTVLGQEGKVLAKFKQNTLNCTETCSKNHNSQSYVRGPIRTTSSCPLTYLIAINTHFLRAKTFCCCFKTMFQIFGSKDTDCRAGLQY